MTVLLRVQIVQIKHGPGGGVMLPNRTSDSPVALEVRTCQNTNQTEPARDIFCSVAAQDIARLPSATIRNTYTSAVTQL